MLLYTQMKHHLTSSAFSAKISDILPPETKTADISVGLRLNLMSAANSFSLQGPCSAHLSFDSPAPVSYTHLADCYNAEAALICGEADYAIHIHNDDCYDTEGNLVCPLPQVEAHEHTEACYEEQQTLVCGMAEEEGHIHDESCYTRTQGETICTDESSEHIHLSLIHISPCSDGSLRRL